MIVGAIHELPLQVCRSDEVEAQSRFERDRWTFYETLKIASSPNGSSNDLERGFRQPANRFYGFHRKKKRREGSRI